ncbi:MAG: substrate-binding periplasmic protein [Psychrobium sp.]
MKNQMLRLLALLTFSWLFSCSANAFTITIAYSEYKPFISQSLPNKGVLNHVVKRAFELENVQVKFKAMSSSKTFKLIEAGKVDASVGWTPTVERKAFATFSSPIYSPKVVLFYRKSHPIHWEKLPTNKVPVFGATKTYYYGDEFADAQQQGRIKVQIANSDKINFKKLIGTRIDAFPIAEDVGRDMLKRKFSKRQSKALAFSSKPLLVEPLSVMFSKKNAANQRLQKKFEQGLAKLKKSGEYQKLINNFNASLR